MSIHPTAIVSPQVTLATDVEIGPHAIVDGHVTVGPGCVVHAGAKILGHTTLGARNTIHSNAVLGDWPQDRKYKGEHSELIIGDDNIFREGTTVHRGTGLNTKTLIGHRCYLMVNAHVGHNCVLGNDITLVNGSMLGGHVHVGDRAIIGGNSAVHQFCRVGRLAMISNEAGLSVDLPPFFISMATNTITQLNAVGLRRSGMTRESINAIRRMFQLAFRDRGGRTLLASLQALPPEVVEVAEVREMIEFCKTSKRGIAKFRAWSDRNVNRPTESGEE